MVEEEYYVPGILACYLVLIIGEEETWVHVQEEEVSNQLEE